MERGKRLLDLIEMDGQVYISFGYDDDDDLLEIELDDNKKRDKNG